MEGSAFNKTLIAPVPESIQLPLVPLNETPLPVIARVPVVVSVIITEAGICPDPSRRGICPDAVPVFNRELLNLFVPVVLSPVMVILELAGVQKSAQTWELECRSYRVCPNPWINPNNKMNAKIAFFRAMTRELSQNFISFQSYL